MMNITDVAVIGAGTMGNGIAHVFAQNGYQVALADK
jgi:3-hydroxybutyryl-CoA dehydrogenase